jgi:hypothetical protein
MAAQGYSPFPTFGGPEQSGGIASIKMNPAQVRFPTASRPASKEPRELSNKEKYAGILPLLVEGVSGFFDKPQAPANYGTLIEDPKTLEDITNNQKIQAYTEADRLYGATEDPNTFGFDEILNTLIAGSMDRGAPAYTQSYLDMRSAKEKNKLSKSATKTSFIKDRLDRDSYQDETYMDLESAKTGKLDLKSGVFSPSDGKRYMNTEDGLVELPSNYIKYSPGASGTDISDFMGEQYKALSKLTSEFAIKDDATMGVVRLGNDLVASLSKAAKDPKYNASTFVSGAVNFGNDIFEEFESVGALLATNALGERTGNLGDYFSKTTTGGDVANGRGGTGFKAEAIAGAIKRYTDTGDSTELDALLEDFDSVYKETNQGESIKDLFGKISYNKTATQAQFLQMAYMAAAASGQTGRTLSDKDLAFFLKIVGQNASSDPEIQANNILRFVDTVIEGADSQVTSRLNPRDLAKYNPATDTTTQSMLQYYYKPEFNPDGTTYNWANYDSYQYQTFRERHRDAVDINGNSIMDQWFAPGQNNPAMYDRGNLNVKKDPKAVVEVPPLDFSGVNKFLD